MRAAIFTYTGQGCGTAKRVSELFPDAEKKLYMPKRFKEEGFLPIEDDTKAFYGGLFSWADVMIFIGSCGIAVRETAPHIRNKATDPAVICIDSSARYVIPLLSGHIGGANCFAEHIAGGLGALAVITTATDINSRFAADAWAARQGFVIEDMSLAKEVSAAVLERSIPLDCEFPVISDYPAGTEKGNSGELGIYVGWRKKSPFKKTLRIITPVIHLGIGCKKNTKAGDIRELADFVLDKYGIDKRAVKCVASIDIKSEEAGLLEYCRENKWKSVFYSAGELKNAKGDFSPSAFVKSVTGVDNVCERAAMLGAKKLVVKKTAANGVTVAAAAEEPEVSFE